MSLSNIYKYYRPEEAVLHDIHLTIHFKEWVAIMGASGSGKSTLMNILGLLDKPSSGEYMLGNHHVSDLTENEAAYLRNEWIGFVFQQFHLLSRLTALENVMLPLFYRGFRDADQRKAATEILEKVGMSHRLHHRPSELSGGQQQRVAIARALVTHPQVILADEPTGALDSHTSEDVMQLFRQIHQEEETSIIIVTHDQNIAAQCKRTIHIKDGKIENELTTSH